MTLRSIKEIEGYVLSAEDGEVGRCKDFLFDDEDWTVRYMVASTGKWLPGRKVLISPVALGEPQWSSQRLPVRLTKEQIEGAPALEEDAPVSRQYELQYYSYYQWPPYWGAAGVWGASPYPSGLLTTPPKETPATVKQSTQAPEDTHLRSCSEVRGYHIGASDGEVGHVEDFVVEIESWTIRYLVIDTRNWLPGRKVLIPPLFADSVDWAQRTVTVDLTREEVRDSPEFDPSAPVNREFEAHLYDYYGRPAYWA